MWQAVVSSILALIPDLLKPKKKDKTYQDLLRDAQEDLKADVIRLKDRKKIRRKKSK